MAEPALGDFELGPEHTQDEALFEEPGYVDRAASAPLALYRRYRPDTFAEVIGQEHVTEPLQRALTNNRVSHAYLFSGPRGCGKTTSARILARALNCQYGPVAVPCGTCQSCRDLARGGPGSIDVIEIDAASHGGVDDARDLRERAFFAPVASRYKIYIIDEAHMVTTAGFNALLKLVEEPPPHVKFIFATTEPEKVIGTIRSRTHHYPFRLVPPRILTDYLGKLCAAEGIAVEPAVLPLVVRAGAGSVRDSLSVLDQLLGGADEEGVAYQQATSLLGYTPDSLLDEFVDAFAAGDAGGVFTCVDKVIEVGQDPRRFAEDLLRRIRDLVLVAAVPDALSSGLVDTAPDQAERLSSQAASLGAGELTRAAEVIAVGLTEMRGTTAPRLHLELMCARVLLPGADADGRGIHARLDRLERRVGMTGAASAAAPTTAPTPAPARTPSADSAPERPAPAPVRPAPAEPAPPTPEGPTRSARPESPGDTGGPAGGETDDTKLDSEPDPDEPAPGAKFTVTDLRRLWPEVLEEVKGKRRFTWILLSQNAQVAELRGNTLLLAMANAGARDSFGRGGSEDVLREALVVVLGADFRIETMVEAGNASAASPRTPPTAPAADPAPPSSPNGSPRESEPQGVSPWDPAPRDPAPWDSAPQDAAPQDAAPRESAPRESRPRESAPQEPGGRAPAPEEAASRESAARAQARQGIRPTREARGPAVEGPDERDEAASRDDEDLDDVAESHRDLLARHLGAEIIAEEEPEP